MIFLRPMTRFLSILLLAVVLLSGCSSDRERREALAVSIAPQQYLLGRIAGNDFDIVTLLPPGSDPETYDPTVTHLMELQNAGIYFRMGAIGFEDAALDKIRENFPMLRIEESAKGIDYITGTHAGPGNIRDPHVWTSVRNAGIMASNFYSVLSRAYPQRKKQIASRYEQLQRDLKQLDDSIAAILAPHRGDSFIIWHPSLSYFAADYGLNQIAVEPDAREIGPKQYKAVIDRAGREHPVVMFYEKEHSPSQSLALARELGIPAVEVSLMSRDWPRQMLAIAHAIDSVSPAH